MSKFKSTNGQHLTLALFIETAFRDKESILYTLKDQDHRGYPSLYRLYMEMADFTEWEFANTYLDGWSHWQTLCNCTWFQPYIQRWRTELELMVKSRALKRMIQKAEEQNSAKESFMIDKFLIEKGWIDKNADPKRRGRPTKAEIQRQAKEEININRQLAEDAKRLDLN